MMNKKTFAWTRAAMALVLAVVFLAMTGFAFVDMLGGPASINDGAVIEDGAYLEADVTFVMDIVGVEKNAAGKEAAYYAVSPVGSSFAVLRFPAADFENISALEAETQSFLQGESLTMDFHMIVTGVAKPADEAASGLLAEWFAENVDWMVTAGVIPQEDDYSAYLSPYVIRAGSVGTMAFAPALVLTVLAALLVVYAIVEAVMILAGVYNKKPQKKQKKAKPVKVEAVAPAAEKAPVAEEAPAEKRAAAEAAPVEEAAEEEPEAEEAFVDESFQDDQIEEENDV